VLKQDNDAIGVVQFLAVVYDQKLSDEKLLSYVTALGDLDETALRKAADEWTRTEKWFPKISELRNLAERGRSKQSGDDLVAALIQENDRALEGEFRPEVYLRLIVKLRNSDREAQADAWRRRYDELRGDVVVDRKKYATDWGSAA